MGTETTEKKTSELGVCGFVTNVSIFLCGCVCVSIFISLENKSIGESQFEHHK